MFANSTYQSSFNLLNSKNTIKQQQFFTTTFTTVIIVIIVKTKSGDDGWGIKLVALVIKTVLAINKFIVKA